MRMSRRSFWLTVGYALALGLLAPISARAGLVSGLGGVCVYKRRRAGQAVA